MANYLGGGEDKKVRQMPWGGTKKKANAPPPGSSAQDLINDNEKLKSVSLLPLIYLSP